MGVAEAPVNDCDRIVVDDDLPVWEQPIRLDARQAEAARFCFLGEFGYEMVSWIPYLLYLKQTLGLRLRSAGRPGSAVFYYFSDDHVELPSTLLGGVWGAPEAYESASDLLGSELLIHPGMDLVNRREISIEGIDWTTRNIHAVIEDRHYARPDFSWITPWSPLSKKPVVVINNKYLLQWPGTFERPVNYLDRKALIQLRDLLLTKGYGVVYNHFFEPTAVDEELDFDDTGIFGTEPGTWDLRCDYRQTPEPGRRNQIQLGLYRHARFIVGTQGGNMYLPAICRKPLFMLMRAGDYIDYTELGRLYDVPVECFYEPRHLLDWLNGQVPGASSFTNETGGAPTG